MYTIAFNTCGSDSLCYVDGRYSIANVHIEAEKHYKRMVKLNPNFTKEYGFKKNAKPSDINSYPFKVGV